MSSLRKSHVIENRLGLPRGRRLGEEWSDGLPYPSPGELPNPEMETASLGSPAFAGRFFTTEPPGKTLAAGYI